MIIINDTYKGEKYNFVKESDITYFVRDVPSEPLLIHSTNDYTSRSVIKKTGLNNGDQVIKFYDSGSMSYIYHWEIMGDVANKYLIK